jgi:hypothetical protein
MAETPSTVVAIDPTYSLGWYNLAVLAKRWATGARRKILSSLLELARRFPREGWVGGVLYRTDASKRPFSMGETPQDGRFYAPLSAI